jgi:hypothetical protein
MLLARHPETVKSCEHGACGAFSPNEPAGGGRSQRFTTRAWRLPHLCAKSNLQRFLGVQVANAA